MTAEEAEEGEPTGESEAPVASDAPAEPEEPAAPTLEEQLAERTSDLQRLQAEYINYKRRVDRDRRTPPRGWRAGRPHPPRSQRMGEPRSH